MLLEARSYIMMRGYTTESGITHLELATSRGALEYCEEAVR
jgi:hypothetical protein